METCIQTFDIEHVIRHRVRAWQPSPTRRFCTSNQRIERSAVAARGRNHQRPTSSASCESMVPMGALVEAGGGYRVKQNGLSQKGNNVSAGGRTQPSPFADFWNIPTRATPRHPPPPRRRAAVYQAMPASRRGCGHSGCRPHRNS